jgi:hypothetical protein
MLKNYSLIGVNVRARKARQQLEKEIVLFDKQFFDLKEFYKDAQGQQKLAATNDLWQEIRKIYYADASFSQLAVLKNKSNTLFHLTDDLMLFLLKTSQNSKGALLNTASSQQMLSQRIVALYALKAWGVVDASYQDEYNKAVTEFLQGLDTLNNNANNTTELTANLAQLRQHFKRFTSTISASNTGNYSLTIAAASAEKLYVEIEEIIMKYQQLAF